MNLYPLYIRLAAVAGLALSSIYQSHAAGSLTISPGDTCTVSCTAGSTPPPVPPSPPPNPVPVPPPAPGPVPNPARCDGFSRVINLTASWASPGRMFTAAAGGFGPNDVVVVAVTPTWSTPSNNLASFRAAEFSAGPSTRIASLSDAPCDFGPQAWPGGNSSGTSVSIAFATGTGGNFGFYPIVPLNTTYYFSIKNDVNAACRTIGSCDIAIDLTRPGQ